MDNKKFRSSSSIFPLLEGEEFESLKADIAANGLLEPIWLHPDGAILDGRNRYRACVDLGVKPQYRFWNGQGSELAFVVSLNLHRRHLTSSQRAALAVEIEPLLAKEAWERQTTLNRVSCGNISTTYTNESNTRARDQAAQIMHTNGRYVQDAKKLKEESPEIFEQVKAGELTIPKAKHAIHFSSETPEWYTPDLIIDKLLELWRVIDLDPCSNSSTAPNVPAKEHYTQEDDGLSLPWRGKIYMNPPYGNELADWVDKLVSEYEIGNISEAIALTPARTDTKWFRALRLFPRCFIFGRLKFSRSDNGAPFPSMLTYLGSNADKFHEVFRGIGDIYTLWQEVHVITRESS